MDALGRVAYDRSAEVGMTEDQDQNKYARLPDPIRPEDMCSTHDVRPQPAEKGEHDRENEWLLRRTGAF